ncbi:NAD-P-binding protein [Dichotomocladium elegans]|nr:NAD-P-binding protein [Dichotomocladium elegans]
MNNAAAKRFITAPQFAVVGASTDRSKYGNRVLRWYQAQGLPVIPVNNASCEKNQERAAQSPKEAIVEDLSSIRTIEELKNPKDTAISIITPPKITLQVLRQAKALGITKLWLQPGAEDKSVLEYANEAGLEIIAGGPCILVSGPSLLAQRAQL